MQQDRTTRYTGIFFVLKGHSIAAVLKGQNVDNPRIYPGVGGARENLPAPTGRDKTGEVTLRWGDRFLLTVAAPG